MDYPFCWKENVFPVKIVLSKYRLNFTIFVDDSCFASGVLGKIALYRR
jgi:hypothetical protein